MSNEEIFSTIADELQSAIADGNYGAWDDLCVEYSIEDPFRPGYVIVVWGKELDTKRTNMPEHLSRYYSVSIHTADQEGHPDEKLLTTYSESADFYDLENAVYAALRELDLKRHAHTLASLMDTAAAARAVHSQRTHTEINQERYEEGTF